MDSGSRIHIVQLFHTYDIEYGGGVTRFALELGKHLDPNEFRVTFCSMGKKDQGSDNPQIKQLMDEGFDPIIATDWVEGTPLRNLYQAIRSLKGRFSAMSVDIVHSHSQYTDLAVTLLKLQSVIPIAMRTVHYGYAKEWRNRSWMRAIFTNFLFPLVFDQEIGINQANTDRLNQRWMARLRHREAVRIYNAINIETIARITQPSEEIKRSLGMPLDVPVIGTIGRLEEQKGTIFLLEAIHRLRTELPKLFALIIGNGPLLEDLKQRARNMGIEDRVIFTGNRSDISNLLNCMDLFVSSSLWEGLPTVVLESMANQIPILATDIPGTNELIIHGVNGWLVKPGSSELIAEGIQKLLSSPTLSKRLGDQGRLTVNKFSIEAITKEYEGMFRQVMENKKRK